MTTKTVIACLYGSKDSMRKIGAGCGLFGDALDKFTRALAEVVVTLEVDNDTGNYKIVKAEEK